MSSHNSLARVSASDAEQQQAQLHPGNDVIRHGACQNRVTFRKLCTNTYCLAMALILFAVWVLFFLSRLEVLA